MSTLAALRSATTADLAYLDAERKWTSGGAGVQGRPNQHLPIDGWSQALAMAGRGFGKRLCKNTPIPTPTGWARLGDMRVGDQVFDESGRVCRITAIFDGMPRVAYRLHFNDGTSIDACDEHQWVTWTHRDRKQYLRYGRRVDFPSEWPSHRGKLYDSWGNEVGEYGPRIRTTQEIVDTLMHSARGDANHCIPTALPLQLPEATLLTDPWVLGYWLGNGNTAQPSLTAGSYRGDMDADFVAGKLTAAGYEFSRRDYPERGHSLFRILHGTFAPPAEARVPPEYLRASEAQRLETLRGLMDSDGSAETSSVEFCSTDKQLALDVLELARSLSERPVIAESEVSLRGRALGPRWRVSWRPSRHNPFSLPRKAVRVASRDGQALRTRHRMIVRVERIDPKPMRCLTVDGLHSMYLCGEGMIPTHNTKLGASWIRRQTGMYPGVIAHVIAPTYSDLRGVVFEGPSGLRAEIPAVCIKTLTYSPYPEMILWNGSIIRGFSSESPDRLRGPQATFVWGDELAAWYRPEECLSNIDFSTRIAYRKPSGEIVQPQKLYTTTPRPLAWLAKMIKGGALLIRGSTYDNRANLAEAFFKELVQYEGTELGRQELHGELIDISEAAIIRKSWLKKWPAADALPWLEYVMVSLDTAFTEKTFDRKTFEADPTACTVWGVFKHNRRWNLMLLECWEDWLGFPDLVAKARREMKAIYGRRTIPMFKPMVGQSFHQEQVKRPDLLIIEEKGSGISLRQQLSNEGVDSYPYNPGNADKTARLHAVSHLAHAGRIWLPESIKNPGEFRDWCAPLLDQLCVYSGPGTTPHDDWVDSCLAGDTRVRMADGSLRRIDSICAGEYVSTPDGPCRVLQAGQTGVKTVWRVEWGGGALVGTANHPVRADGEWKALASLCLSATLTQWHSNANPAFASKPFDSTATRIAAIRSLPAPRTASILVARADSFIGMCGSIITAPFRRATRFITSTRTPGTTTSQTLNAFPAENIALARMLDAMKPFARLGNWRTSRAFANWLSCGTEARKVASGIASTLTAVSASPAPLSPSARWRRLLVRALSVGTPFLPNRTAPNSAPLRVKAVMRVNGAPQPVFNLRVEGAECYFAEDILVHNCSQAWRVFADKFVSGGLDQTIPEPGPAMPPSPDELSPEDGPQDYVYMGEEGTVAPVRRSAYYD
jgi:hypothetical protein